MNEYQDRAGVRMTNSTSRAISLRSLVTVAAVILTVACGLVAQGERARTVPPPAVDEQHVDVSSAGGSTGLKPRRHNVAVLAGGCFWGVQGVFQHVKGVTNAVSGYAGGAKDAADYHLVSSGGTGHAEAVQVTYDPRQITYGRLLQIYFSVAHDPTQLNRQGPDVGSQYRSAIFPTSDEQARVAKAYIAQLTAARAFDNRIVTTIESDRTFYPAEAYHQNYLVLHPQAAYIAINDLPKVDALKRLFPTVYREDPILVAELR
jgi:peptide-methionine (S)-S-oxide reductase